MIAVLYAYAARCTVALCLQYDFVTKKDCDWLTVWQTDWTSSQLRTHDTQPTSLGNPAVAKHWSFLRRIMPTVTS